MLLRRPGTLPGFPVEGPDYSFHETCGHRKKRGKAAKITNGIVVLLAVAIVRGVGGDYRDGGLRRFVT